MDDTPRESRDETTSTPIRWGIVGPGAIATHFARDIALARGAALTAVSARSSEKAQAFARAHGGLAACGSVTALAARTDVDAVYVATPNTAHVDAAIAALDAGKAVVVEKPLATTSAEARRLADHAKTRGVFLMEAMWTRFLPTVAKAKALIDAGTIGPVRAIRGELAFEKPFDPEDRLYNRALGGGVLLDLGVYPISLALFLMGRPDAVDGTWRPAPNGIDGAATIDLRFGGAPARLSCAFDRRGDNQFVVAGETATLILQAPFNRTAGLVVTRSRMLRRLACMPGGSLPARAARKAVAKCPLPATQRSPFPFEGYGLQFEIEAASDAIRAGKTEHGTAPLDHTVETLGIVETVLAKG